MADNKAKRGGADRRTVAAGEGYEVNYFARKHGITKQQGYALIPLSLYFKGSRVKVQVGLCRGKKLYDKREDAARRDMRREAERALKEHNAR